MGTRRNGEDDPVLMLHGLTGVGRREWQAQLSPFTDEFRVILPDLCGHGATNNPAGRMAMNHRQLAAGEVLQMGAKAW